MIEAFHSLWTKPYLISNLTSKYEMKDYELLVMILSALNWRKKNGRLRLITDSIGLEYIRSLELEFLWDNNISCFLDKVPEKINPKYYWAAGKLYALSSVQAPIVMLDMDLIVWNRLNFDIWDKDVVVIHEEEIMDGIYPNKEYFEKSGYIFNSDWNWKVEPVNTAFLYISNNEFKQYYVSNAIDFMINNYQAEDRVKNMVFAEQRLLTMCAEYKKKSINKLYNISELNKQKDFTHIWGEKKNLNKQNEFFCKKCLRRIINDFPYMLNKYIIKKLYRKYF